MAFNALMYEFWKPFLFLFDVLCISHFKALNSVSKTTRIVSHLYILLNTIFVIIAHITIYNWVGASMENDFERNDSSLFIYVNYSEFVTNLAAHLILHFESIAKRNKHQELLENLCEINEEFQNRLSLQIDLQRLRKRFLWRQGGLFVLIFATLFGSCFYFTPGYSFDECAKMVGQLLYMYVMLVVRTRCLQIDTFIRFVGDMHENLNGIIARVQRKSTMFGKRMEMDGEALLECNYIYLNVWCVTTLISDCFGWSMVGITVQSFVDIMNTLYWIFINIDSVQSDDFTLSKRYFILYFFHFIS